MLEQEHIDWLAEQIKADIGDSGGFIAQMKSDKGSTKNLISFMLIGDLGMKLDEQFRRNFVIDHEKVADDVFHSLCRMLHVVIAE